MRILRLASAVVALAAGQTVNPFDGDIVLGCPTDRSVVLSVLARSGLEAYVEYGLSPGAYTEKTATHSLAAGKPSEIPLSRLQPDRSIYYRLRYRRPGSAGYAAGSEYSFHSQRGAGTTFTFGVQGDSHPERLNRMYHPDLYLRTLELVHRDHPDFYVTLGDDFNVDPLYNRGQMNPEAVGRLYAAQRQFLGPVTASTPLFQVNGNHEQAAAYLLNGTPNSPPVLAGLARNLFFPNPAPDGFYTGDAERVEFVGLPRDYYAWSWGEGLFVTLDFYWHSPVQVDEGIGGQAANRPAGGQGGPRKQGRGGGQGGGSGQGARQGQGRRGRDLWGVTLGDAQYHWLQKTLQESKARYKFVFCHHVLGTGRGGVEMADLGEWGGRNSDGQWEFDKMRPGWDLPIHQLMNKYGVTIFFQGHDHLFARQRKDDVTYQETPNPADITYTAFNEDAYRSGDTLPNSGYLRVTVSPANVRVDYVRAYLPKDESPERKNGEVAFAYSVSPRYVR